MKGQAVTARLIVRRVKRLIAGPSKRVYAHDRKYYAGQGVSPDTFDQVFGGNGSEVLQEAREQYRRWGKLMAMGRLASAC